MKKNRKKKNKIYKAVNDELNMQMVVVGPPGSKKTTGFVLPNIFHICDIYKNSEERADIILTDPKPELFIKTSNYLEKNGYDVKVLDFIDLKYGDRFNPIDFINDDKTLMEVSKGYVNSVESATGGSSAESAFWNGQESQLLASLIGFVKQTKDKNNQNFKEVLKILTSDDVSDNEKAKDFFERNNVTGAPLQLFRNFLSITKAENTKSNITGGLAQKLDLFITEGLVNLTSSTDIDIRKLGKKKEKPIALFIFMPDSDRTYSPIINVIINMIFKQLYKTAYETNNRLEVPVYLILEEMANIGKIDGIKEMLGTMRGRRIYPMMIWQSLSQMKERYKDGFEDIMSMCDTHVYLGINDEFTANYCSRSLGETTIKVSSTNNRKDKYNISDGESESYQGRALLLPNECMEFDNDKMIVKQRASSPMILYKVQYKYWENPICEDKKVSDLRKIIKYVDTEEVNLKNNKFELDSEFSLEENYEDSYIDNY